MVQLKIILNNYKNYMKYKRNKKLIPLPSYLNLFFVICFSLFLYIFGNENLIIFISVLFKYVLSLNNIRFICGWDRAYILNLNKIFVTHYYNNNRNI